MAAMTQAQITAELLRKAAAGKKPTNTANQTQYDAIVKSQNAAPETPNNTINKTPTNGQMGISSVDPAAVAAHQQAAEAFKAANWGPNGTANGMTENQNLAAVIQQSGSNSINGTTATPYINSKGETDYHITGQPDTVESGSGQSLGSQLTELASNGASNNANNQVIANATPQANSNSLIQSIYDAMYASQAQKLKAARDSQLAGLAGQDDLAKQNARNSLNANDVSGARLAQQLKESMANAGLGSSGDYISAQVGQNTGQQQNANTINQDMSNKLQQLLTQKDAINNNASADDLALLQSIQAQMGQSQLNQSNADRSYGLDLAGLTGNINGQQTLASKSLGLQAQNQGFNQNLQTNQYNLGAQNQGFNQNLATTQQQQSEANTKFAQQQQIDAVTYSKARDSIADKQYQATFDNNIKQQGFDNALKTALQAHQISNDNYQLAISKQNANTNAQQAANSNANQQIDNALQQAKFTYDTDKNNIDNLYKQSQIDKNAADAARTGLDDAYYKAVGLAQKDPLFATYDASKQTQIINTHYENLKPKSAVTDGDISQYLNKK